MPIVEEEGGVPKALDDPGDSEVFVASTHLVHLSLEEEDPDWVL